MFRPYLDALFVKHKMEYRAEYKFLPTRRWRFDYAFPQWRIAVEIEGGTWLMGRHNRGAGYEKDCVKYNEAAKMGWIILRYTPTMLHKVSVIDDIKAIREYQLLGHDKMGG